MLKFFYILFSSTRYKIETYNNDQYTTNMQLADKEITSSHMHGLDIDCCYVSTNVVTKWNSFEYMMIIVSVEKKFISIKIGTDDDATPYSQLNWKVV